MPVDNKDCEQKLAFGCPLNGLSISIKMSKTLLKISLRCGSFYEFLNVGSPVCFGSNTEAQWAWMPRMLIYELRLSCIIRLLDIGDSLSRRNTTANNIALQKL